MYSLFRTTGNFIMFFFSSSPILSLQFSVSSFLSPPFNASLSYSCTLLFLPVELCHIGWYTQFCLYQSKCVCTYILLLYTVYFYDYFYNYLMYIFTLEQKIIGTNSNFTKHQYLKLVLTTYLTQSFVYIRVCIHFTLHH